MILTGKAKEDFLTKMSILTEIKDKKDLEEHFIIISDLIKNAYYVDFFDSVNITIDRDTYNKKMIITNWMNFYNEEQTVIDCGCMEPFQDWWEEAIKKANEIYNETTGK